MKQLRSCKRIEPSEQQNDRTAQKSIAYAVLFLTAAGRGVYMYEQISLIDAKKLMKIMKIGKDKAYALLRSDSFPSVQIGASFYVTEENLRKWLNEAAHKKITL